MDRETAVHLAQQASKAKNKRLVDAGGKSQDERGAQPDCPIEQLPLLAVTCSTGWEC